MPLLRNRREDIPYLTSAFVADRPDVQAAGARRDARRGTYRQAVLGSNVRELRTIERACILADGPFITDRDVSRDPVSNGHGNGIRS